MLKGLKTRNIGGKIYEIRLLIWERDVSYCVLMKDCYISKNRKSPFSFEHDFFFWKKWLCHGCMQRNKVEY